MNLNVTPQDLTPAEFRVTELYTVRYRTAKEISVLLGKSISTVKNQLNSVFVKADVHKDTELTAWFIFTRYIACILFLILTTYSIFQDTPMIRTSRTVKTCRTSKTKRNDLEIEI
jgi:DNA-binding CsgD family transcriptional regulator